MLCYPILRAEIAKRGVKKGVIAQTLGVTPRALQNKLNGETNFTWPEVCTINDVFFPDMDKDTLFVREAHNAED